MKEWLGNRWVQVGLSVLLGGIFLYAGASKMTAPQAFADSIATFRLLPAACINLLALGLPVFEIVLGLLLVVGWQRRAAALGVLGLAVVFALALSLALARGLPVDCGCFGGGTNGGKYYTWGLLGRDLLLGAAATAIYWREKAARAFTPCVG